MTKGYQINQALKTAWNAITDQRCVTLAMVYHSTGIMNYRKKAEVMRTMTKSRKLQAQLNQFIALYDELITSETN